MELQSSSSSSSQNSKKKKKSKKFPKPSSLNSAFDLDRQQRCDVRRLNRLLKKYDRKAFEENNRNSGNSSDSTLNHPDNTSTIHAAGGSINNSPSVSNSARSFRIIRNNSAESSNSNSSNRKEFRYYKKHHSTRPKTECSSSSDLNDLRRYLSLAFKNSLGHMHDHLIATLPTEMSLYYKKLHDTLLLDMKNDDESSSINNQTSNSTSSVTSNHQQVNEIHEFTSVTSNEPLETSSNVTLDSNSIPLESLPAPRLQPQQSTSSSSNYQYYATYNPYAPPLPKPGILPIRDFLHDPLNASLTTLNRVTNLVRLPTYQLYSHGYNILNTLANPANIPGTLTSETRPPGMAERVLRDDRNTVSMPPPVLPLIQCTHRQMRLDPINLEEFEATQSWTIDALEQRVFKGGISEELRLRLWPFILGLYDDTNDISDVRHKQFDWSSKEKLFEHYRSQWKSILPEQEKRFMLFRERKSLIERDVIRCDRTHPFYYGDQNENLDKLKQLLLTYMMYDFDTGYVQGMSDLASPLLYVAQGDTCKAFWFFVKIMQFTNNNFEMSQLTIKYQLEMLWKLIEITDPIFAQYLVNNESVNCYFAFRWIVCQFKREFMKSNSDDYQEVLLLWESIWTCSSVKKYLQHLKQQKQNETDSSKSNENLKSIENVLSSSNSSSKISLSDGDEKIVLSDHEAEASTLARKLDNQCKIVGDSSSPLPNSASSSTINNTNIIPNSTKSEFPLPQTQSSKGTNQKSSEQQNDRQQIMNSDYYDSNGSQRKRLSDTELYVLCICLAIIRRERDLIMAQRFDATEILKHFNTLRLTTNLKNILIHAANIWSWLIFDGNDKLLYCQSEHDQIMTYGGNSNSSSQNPSYQNSNGNQEQSSIDTEDFDLLQDFRMPMDRQMSSAEDYYIFNNI